MSKFIGIDISKKTFDIAYQKQEKWVYSPLSNNEKGFQALLKHLNKDDYVIMEASGPYSVPLSYLSLSKRLSSRTRGHICAERVRFGI